MKQIKLDHKVALLTNILLIQGVVVFFIITLDRIATIDSNMKAFLSSDLMYNILLIISFFLTAQGLWLARTIVRYAGFEQQAASQRVKLLEYEKFISALRSQRHDFLNHLQVISGLVTLKRHAEIESFVWEIVSEINKETQIVRLVDHVELNALLLSKLKTAEELQVTFNVYADNNLQFGDLSPLDLTRVIGNLVENALLSSADVPDISKRVVTLTIDDMEGSWVFSIKNTLPIIPKELQEKIFERGFTTRGERGQGLGLTNVQEIVHKNKGKLSLVSKEGVGTVFTVMFPKQQVRKGS